VTNVRDRLANRVARWAGRPTLVAVAAANLVTGLYVAITLAPLSFGNDISLYRECALQAASGGPACGSLYPPLAAFVALPLTWVPPTVAAIAGTLVGVTILMAGVIIETRGFRTIDRVLVAVAAISFAPVVYELLLGQVTLLMAAALYPVIRRPDAARNGAWLGAVLALAPKPMLLAVLAWMLFWRRRALMLSLSVALLLTCAGVAIVGPDQYAAWMGVLTGAGRASVSGTFSLSLSGNMSLWPLDPLRGVLVIVIGLVALWTIWRDPSRGFVAALLAGLMLAPYTQLYAASILLLAVKPAVGFAPRATRLMALTGNVVLALLQFLVPWAIVGLAVAALGQGSPERTGGHGPPVPVTRRTTGF